MLCMIVDFCNRGTEDVFNGVDSKAANMACPKSLWRTACRKLDQLDTVANIDELRAPPGNRLELLRGDRKGQYSIRINDQYRVCFFWTDTGPSAVEIIDYH